MGSYQEKKFKNAKNDVFATFALKNALFSPKTGAKAHTRSQQGRTSMNKRFPVENCTIEKIFHTILEKTDSSGMRGGTFAVFFLNSQTS